MIEQISNWILNSKGETHSPCVLHLGYFITLFIMSSEYHLFEQVQLVSDGCYILLPHINYSIVIV